MRQQLTLVAFATIVMSGCAGTAPLSTGTALMAPPIASPSGVNSASHSSEPLSRAVALVRAQPGYRFRFELALSNTPEVSTGLAVSGTGTVDQLTNRSSMLLDVRSVRDLLVASGEVTAADVDQFLVDGTIEIMQDRSTVFARMPAVAQRLGSSGPWLSIATPPETDPANGSLGVPGALDALSGGVLPSPADYMAQLQQLDPSAQAAGTEMLQGASTTRYTGTLDLRTLMAARMTPAQAAELNSMMPFLDAFKLPFDVWIDADGLPRRLVLTMKLESLIGAAIPQGTTGTAGAVQPAPSLRLTYDLSDYGTAGEVRLPSADQVTVVDPRQLETLR